MKRNKSSKVGHARRVAPLILSLAMGISLNPTVAQALSFNFTSSGVVDPQAFAGFQAAGDVWSSVLTDPVTINVQIGYASLGGSILAQTNFNEGIIPYSSFRTVIRNDRITADDFTAFSNLPSGTSFNLLIDYTSNSPNGAGSATPYLDNDGDANNTTIRMTFANAKALGLLPANNSAIDAQLTFNSDLLFDFDRTNGINSGSYDFVGLATHEIGHALGFISGVDILDSNSPNGTTYYPDNAFTYVYPLDMYRFSGTSITLGGFRTIDWTANNETKYFSIDGGATSITTFSTGISKGDGLQASHWKDNLGIGILDPTAARGELLQITNNDIRALDVIGYNPIAVPYGFSPTLGMFMLGLWCLSLKLKHRFKSTTHASKNSGSNLIP